MAEIYDDLQNPFIGWCPWACWGPYSQPHTLAYAEIMWRDLEPTKNNFDWSGVESYHKFDYWFSRGVRIVLRLACDDPGIGTSRDIPDWLYNEISGSGTSYNNGGGFSPNYSHSAMISNHQRVITALGNRYNNDPRIAFVQVGSLGHWGEFHTVHLNYGDAGYMPPISVSDQYVQHYINAFPNKKLLSRRPFQIFLDNNIGLFNDMFGNPTETGYFIDYFQNGYSCGNDWGRAAGNYPAMPDFWKYGPSGGEFGDAPGTQYLQNGTINATLQQAADSHTSWIGPCCPADLTVGCSIQNNITAIHKAMGYRFVFVSASHNGTVTAGSTLNVSMTWNNKGNAPFYYSWPLELSLINSGGNIIAQTNTNEDIRTWIPGQRTISHPISVPSGLPNGTYTICVAIIDPETGNPGVNLANDGRRTDGRYAISTVTISATTDNTSPTISSIAATNITSSGAMISWTTNEPADTKVEYGATSSYGNSTTLNTALVIDHSVSLTGLAANSTYYYRVVSKDGSNNSSQSSAQTFTTTITPANTITEISDSLNNPFMGWVTWAEYGACLQPVTLAYVRILWRTLEPTKGNYDWSTFESTNNLSYWTSHGVKFVFRVVMDDPGSGTALDIPDWLYTEIEGQGTSYGSGAGFSPNYSHANLISNHARLIQALANRYNNDTRLAFIQLGTIGHWGEFHTTYLTVTDQGYMPPISVSNQYVQHYLDYFTNKRILIRRPFQIAKDSHMGLFNDMFGNATETGYFTDYFLNGYSSTGDWGRAAGTYPAMPDFWQQAPSGGEFGGTTMSTFFSDGAINSTIQQARECHTSYLGPCSPSFETLNGSLQTNINALHNVMGYRFVIESESHAASISAGGVLYSTINWNNKGVAPFYFPWPVELSLADGNGTIVTKANTSDDIRTWLPGKFVSTQPIPIPAGLASGTYVLCIAIIDPDTGNPGIYLANTGRRTDGRYALTNVIISGGGGSNNAPVITSVLTSNVTATSVVISWVTDKPSSSQVLYNNGIWASNTTVDSNMVTSHSVTLSSLSQGIIYYFQVKSVDEQGRASVSSTMTFTTVDTSDTTAPIVTDYNVTEHATDAYVSWDTNEPTMGRILYGTTMSLGLSTDFGSSYDYMHGRSLTNLAQGTSYYFAIENKDANNNISTTPIYSFVTIGSTDTVPPVLSNETAGQITYYGAIITWNTDEPATSLVEYGLTNGLGSYSYSDGAMSTTHTIELTGLNAGTTYYYRARSSDASGNMSVSMTHSLATTASPTTPPTYTKISVTTSGTTRKSIGIVVTTDKPCHHDLHYGTTTSFGSVTSNSGYSYVADFVLTEFPTGSQLLPGTTYYYKLYSKDVDGNEITSDTLNASTLPADSSVPVPYNECIVMTTQNSFTVNWVTECLGNSAVIYGLTTGLGSIVTQTAFGITHSVTVTGLTANTKYYYRVKSEDSFGNVGSSPTFVVVTGPSQYSVVNSTITIGNDGIVSPLSLEISKLEWVLPPIRESKYEANDFNSYVGFRDSLELGTMKMRGIITYTTAAEKVSKTGALITQLLNLYSFNYLTYEYDTSRVIMVKLNDKPEYSDYPSFTEVNLTFDTYPYWMDTTESEWTYTGGTYWLTLPEDAYETPFTLTITGVTGDATATVNNVQMRYDEILVPSDVVVIDTERMKVTKNGLNAYANFVGEFPSLIAGQNAIGIAVGTGVSYTFRCKTRYL